MTGIIIRNTKNVIIRNNAKRPNEWHVFTRDALPANIPFVSNEEISKLLDWSKKVATVEVKDMEGKVISCRLPASITMREVVSLVNELNG